MAIDETPDKNKLNDSLHSVVSTAKTAQSTDMDLKQERKKNILKRKDRNISSAYQVRSGSDKSNLAYYKGIFKPDTVRNTQSYKVSSIVWWCGVMLKLNVQDFEDFYKTRSKKEMFVAEMLAYELVSKSRDNLGYLKELLDRTDGKALPGIQFVDNAGLFASNEMVIKIEKPTNTAPVIEGEVDGTD